MTHKIYPCLWFDGKAKEAATYYCDIFKDASILEDQGMVVRWKIADKIFMGLNGGPHFEINPSISFFVGCKDEKELDSLWNDLSAGGNILMPLDKYPWNEKYGWCQDKFGVNWQLLLGDAADGSEKIVPSLMFTQHNSGKVQQAIDYYTTVFTASEIIAISKYEEGEGDVTGNIKYASLKLNGQSFIMMESSEPHQFVFNEALSFVIPCDSQEEIDYFWNEFTKDGEESMCGWCKDQFGVSWQIVPANIGNIMMDKNKGHKAMQVLMKMKKIIVADLENV